MQHGIVRHRQIDPPEREAVAMDPTHETGSPTMTRFKIPRRGKQIYNREIWVERDKAGYVRLSLGGSEAETAVMTDHEAQLIANALTDA